MVNYPLPKPNLDNVIQTDISEKDQQRRDAIKHLAVEAALYPTFEEYASAIQKDILESVPVPNMNNLELLVGDEYGSIRQFYESVIEGRIGEIDLIDTMQIKLIRSRAPPGMTIQKPDDMLTYAKSMSDYDREHLKVFHLDSANRIIGVENISTGTLNSSTAHPRETVKGALLNNSAGVIIAHNHPSGVITPSEADKKVAQGLINAFGVFDIKVLDFVIIGGDMIKSFVDDNVMPSVSPFVREMGASSHDEHGACSVAYQAALEVMSEKCGDGE